MQEYVIETRDLAKRYGPTDALAGLTMSVPRGSVCGLLGRNGAGKTTAIKLLLGMAVPSGGEARVLGLRADDPRESVEIRARTGFAGEDKRLYDFMRVGQAVAFTRSFYPTWRADVEARLFDAFALAPERKIETLSKGERTKLALLLALARGAELLVLDEPTEGLDPAAAEVALQAIVSLVAADGVTVLFSSHQIAEVEQVADRVCIVDHGRAVVEGAIDDLRGRYRRVHLVFDGEAPGAELAAAGIAPARVEGRSVSLLVGENVDEVVGRARASGARAVDVEPVTLKEIFLESVEVRR